MPDADADWERYQECPNSIDQRIAGQTHEARVVKNAFYLQLHIGNSYDYKGWEDCLLLGYAMDGDCIILPFGLSEVKFCDPDELEVVESSFWDSERNVEEKAKRLAEFA